MGGKKKAFVAILMVVLLAAVIVGLVWHMGHYVMVDFRFYPRNAASLDLRDREITVEHYEKLCRQLPQCVIHWNVPFQDGAYPEDSEELTVDSLTAEDVERLKLFTSLKTLHAEQCTDYDQILALREQMPELTVVCNVTLDGQTYSNDAKTVTLSRVTQEEVKLLRCLPELETVVVRDGEDTANMDLVRDYCHDRDIRFCVETGGERVSETADKISLEQVTDGELNLLSLLPQLEQAHIVNPQAPAQNLAAFQDANTGVDLTWELEIDGQRIDSQAEEVDLSQVTLESLDQVKRIMEYFPDAQQVFLGEPGFENEDIAAYREEVRQDYKVVWVVRFGGEFPTRTDTQIFAPGLKGCPIAFTDKVSYNLRYCEDMVCMDIGHMGGITDVSFLAYMPDLEYLILAHTGVMYIDAISNCKKLKFLELDWSGIRDLAPLAGCTSLEDLNFGKTFPEVEGILEMTWLKNVYMIFGSGADAYQISQALPNTRVVTHGAVTVGSGWRNLPNYYAMRDWLGEPYMNG